MSKAAILRVVAYVDDRKYGHQLSFSVLAFRGHVPTWNELLPHVAKMQADLARLGCPVSALEWYVDPWE